MLTGGASATYGADAVAGVVNFCTRRMDGVEIRAGWSGYRHDNSNGYIQGLLDARNFDYPPALKALTVRTIKSTLPWVATLPMAEVTPRSMLAGESRQSCVKKLVTYSAGALTGSGLGVGGSANAVMPNFRYLPLRGLAAYRLRCWQLLR